MESRHFRTRLLFSTFVLGLSLILSGCASMPEIIIFEANPATIRNPGDVSTLKWHTENATWVSISDFGSVESKGSKEVKPEKTTTYVLTAANEDGKITRKVDVSVLTPSTSGSRPKPKTSNLPPPTPPSKTTPSTPSQPTSEEKLTRATPPKPGSTSPSPPKLPNIRSFFADPDEIARGSVKGSILMWVTENAISASISNYGEAQPVNEGSISVRPGATTRYVMTAKNSAGQVTKSETIAVVVIEPKIKKPDQNYPRDGQMLKGPPGEIDPKRITELKWKPVSDADSRFHAQSYDVEIDFFGCCVPGKWCSEVKGGKVMKISSVKTPYCKFEFNHPNFDKIIGDKKGRWRVRAVNKKGEVGEKSDWSEFRYAH